MPASQSARRSGSHHNHSSHNQDNRRGNGGNGGNGKSVRKWVNEPPKDAAEAQRRIDALTAGERQKIEAYFLTGSFAAAAKTLECDPDTISKLWKRVSACFGVLIKDVQDTRLQPQN